MIVYFSVTLRDAWRAGALLPLFFQKGGKGAELTFHHSIIGNFNFVVDMIQSNQIYCSYSRTHNIQKGFLHSLLLFVRSTLLLKRNNHIGEEFCVFCKFAFPSIPSLTPALRLLPVFYLISPINLASPQTWLSKFRSQNCEQNFLQRVTGLDIF